MNSASLCIGPSEPSFIVALSAGVAGSLLLGVLLGRMEGGGREVPLSPARRNLVWFAALVVTVGGQLLLLDRLFTWQHPGEVLCTSFVWKWFFLPPIILFLTGALWGVRERNRQTPKAD